MRYGILASLLLVPSLSHAAVMLSEIAWMGTTIGPNEEWIEFHNNGADPVLVDGWVLSDTNTLAIPLSGTIPSGSFVVLERSDDDTVPGVTAFVTYTGALANTGTTLTLRDAEGTVVDQVVGGENWQNIGGDNTTKQTPQRTTTSWVTGTPTPGVANVLQEQPDEEEETAPPGAVLGAATAQKKDTPGVRISMVPSTDELELSILTKEVSYVNQAVSFTALPKGAGESIQNSLKYAWNFGDTYTGSGKTASHAYTYPGTYVVALNATYARHDVTVHKTIEVLPVTLALSRTEEGDVTIQNTGERDIDLSGYAIKGLTKIVFPQNTILLRGGMLTVDRDRLEAPLTRSSVVVLDTERVVVASESSKAPVTLTAPSSRWSRTPQAAKPVSAVRVTTEPSVLGVSDTAVENTDAQVATSEEGVRTIPVYAKANDQGEGSQGKTGMLSYLGLIGIVVLGILVLYTRRPL